MEQTKRSILVVDDASTWRRLFQALLKKDQYENIVCVESYSKAITEIIKQKSPFHVAIVDIRLQDQDPENIDGLNLISLLNAQGELTNIIVVTGFPEARRPGVLFRKFHLFDYITKDKSFEPSNFRNSVREAVEDSEQRRKDSFLYKERRILIIHSELENAKRLQNSLQQIGYDVDLINNFEQDLPITSYDLIILPPSPISSHTHDILFKIREASPETKIILTTEIDINPIMQALQRGEIDAAVTVDRDGFDELVFMEMVRHLFAPEATKYLTAKIINPPDGKLRSKQEATLELQLYDTYQNESKAIGFVSKGIKPADTDLSVFVYANDTQIKGDQAGNYFWWHIPPHGSPPPLHMQITPQSPGRKFLTVDIEQHHNWLGRLEKSFDVEPAQSI